MNRLIQAWLFLGSLCFLAPAGYGLASPWQTNPHGQVRFISAYHVAPSSGPILFGLHFKMNPGWHTYYKDPGDAGYPPRINWKGSRGFARPELLFPEPRRYRKPGNVLVIGYEKEVVYPIQAERAAGPLRVVAEVSYLTCDGLCVPYQYTFTLDIPSGPHPKMDSGMSVLIASFPAAIGGESRQAAERGIGSPTESFGDDGSVTLWGILLLAFIGGMILNLMPCVLPVLSIKLFGLLQHGGQSRYVIARDALASVGGILASFMALAGAAVAAKSVGRVVGWGIQFQEPLFVAGLSLVLALFALNLWGLFDIQLPPVVARLGAVSPEDPGPGSYFVGGLFTTLLATPCSAPFLGTAVGFALTQAAGVMVLVFLFVGLGLASPYIVLALFPGALRWLPKPGAWMRRLRAVLGWLLAATVAWLAFILSRLVSAAGLSLFALGLAAMFFIVAWRQMRGERAHGRAQRWAVRLLMVLAAGGSLWAAHAHRLAAQAPISPDSRAYQWIPFDEREIDRLDAAGQWIFVDVTADWCLTCQLNEKVVLESQEVLRAMEGVIMMRADWTQHDPAIGRYLAKFGRAGIPFYVLYRPGRPPVVLSEFLTKRKVLDALRS